MLTSPMRDRFGILNRLEMYTVDQLTQIVTRSARILQIDIEEAGAQEIARRSRGRRASPTGFYAGFGTMPRLFMMALSLYR